MNITFENKVVVITGAAGGLGSAMAKKFAADGASVAVCDRENADKTAGEIREAGGEARAFGFDLTNRSEVDRAMEEIAKTYGKIDILVNNAGINVGPDDRRTIDQFSDQWWDAIINVDLTGVFNCSKSAARFFGDSAVIINISSIVGLVPLRNQSAFAAAKGAVVNLTKAMALELAPKGIRVNCVAPGSIGIAITNRLWQKDSAMQGLLSHIPMNRQGTPEEIADAVLFLAGDCSAYTTGAVLAVDGGWTCGGFARNF